MTPIEGFVVSRIDGSATTQDLADLTSLEPDDIQRTIEKLISLGAVEWADGSMGLPRTSHRPGTPAEAISRIAIPGTPRPPGLDAGGLRPPSAAQATARVGLRAPEVGRDRTPSGERPLGAPEGSRAAPGSAPRAASPSGAPPAAASSEEGLAEEGPAEEGPAEDGIELAPERRARVDDLFPRLDDLDHYEILGLPRHADAKQVRAAYFELSKVFHPDTAFRKNLGPYKAKMEGIFKRLTEAYDVLGKKKARAEYDAYLGLQSHLREVEDAIGGAAAQPEPPPAPEPQPAPEPARPVPVAEPRAMSEEGKRRARELLQMRLGAAAAARPSSPPPASSPSPDEPSAATPRGREGVLRDLTASLKDAASRTGGLDAVQRHVLEARRLEQQGDLAGAAKELRLAVALAPDRREIASEQQRVARLLAVQLAEQYAVQAEYEERHRKWGAAALSWAKVVEGRPDDPAAHLRAAAALVEAKGDLHKAQRLAQRACELAPADPVARRTLGQVFVAAGLHLNARRELERAAALDPSDPIVKNLLRGLLG